MKPTDLPLLTSVSAPTVSPDGAVVVFGTSRPDLAADAAVGQLWQVPSDASGPATRLTRGFRDTAPAFSPDGSLVAFLRAAPDGAPQIHVIRAGGSEAAQVTDEPLGVSQFSWAPDSARLVFVARVPEKGRYGTVPGLSAAAEPARLLTTTKYLSNGVGYIVDRPAQVFLVDVPDLQGEPAIAPVATVDGPPTSGDDSWRRLPRTVQLTDADADHSQARFTPDARAVTFVAARHSTSDDDLRSSAWRLEVDHHGTAGATTELVTPSSDLGVGDVLVTASGAAFLLAQDLGPTGLDFVGTNTALYTLGEPGSTPTRLTDPETTDLGASGLVAAGDDAVFATDTTRGTVQLLRADAGGRVDRLTRGAVEITGVSAAGGTVAVSVHDASTMGDVAVVGDGDLVRLTDFSAPLRAGGLIEARELVVRGRHDTEIHGWVLEPEGEGPHPTLLVIHGGPYSQFTGSVFDEAQVYAAAGYGVVMCNPRGASGYGQAFGRAIKGAMGTVDLTDVLDYLDGALAATPSLDADRLGIMGGSYGGYLTAWTIAHDHRFAGAIVERGFLDAEFFAGTSDIGTFFGDQYTGHDLEVQRAQSPQTFVHQVRTPTFVVHSEDDLRCPLSQAQRYHLGLVRAGVTTKMLVFPGENHELSRAGRPRHRLQRFEAILDWWHEYLPVSSPAN